MNYQKLRQERNILMNYFDVANRIEGPYREAWRSALPKWHLETMQVLEQIMNAWRH